MKLYIDIETAPETADYSTYRKSAVWESRYCKDKPEDITPADWYYERSWLFAEFSKIVCISLWYVDTLWEWKVWSLFGHDEAKLLTQFNASITKIQSERPKDTIQFVGHNIISYDLPFIWKRCIINWLSPHKSIDATGKKPRDVTAIDTMNIWKQTAWSSAWLETIAICLNVPSPKDDISGKDVWALYRSDAEDRLERIKTYCEKDVYTTYLVHDQIIKLLPS